TAKAIELIEDGGVVPTTRTGVYHTVGTNGEIYKTAATGCTCPAGLTGRYVCYHRIAGEIVEATRQTVAYELVGAPSALGLAASPAPNPPDRSPPAPPSPPPRPARRHAPQPAHPP